MAENGGECGLSLLAASIVLGLTTRNEYLYTRVDLTLFRITRWQLQTFRH